MVSHWPKRSVKTFFSFLESKTPVTPPTEFIDDILKAAEDDIQHETTKPATVEITSSELKEEKNKLIQKETMETGSVSLIFFYCIYYTEIFRWN